MTYFKALAIWQAAWPLFLQLSQRHDTGKKKQRRGTDRQRKSAFALFCHISCSYARLQSVSTWLNQRKLALTRGKYLLRCHHLHSLATFLAAMLFLGAFQHGCTNGALSTPSQQHDAGQKSGGGTDNARRSHELSQGRVHASDLPNEWTHWKRVWNCFL